MNHLLTVLCRYFFLATLFTCFVFFNKAFSQSCNNWLGTPSTGSFVTIGDLDVTGNKLTVEAVFNRVSALGNGFNFGKLVSKHTDQTNVNYSLMPLQCEITTDVTGYVATPQVCLPTLDKTYHVAMVYDGVTLKFYRDGYLLTETPCTGNLVNNNLLTTIGQLAGPAHPLNMQHLGYINEVRIWNTARTQTELRAYMHTALPAPVQPGLVGYYSFNNLLNKQGTVAFNGTLNGQAQINQTNTNCAFAPDSCGVILSPSCSNWLNTPSQPSWVNVGDIDVPGNQLTVEALINIKGIPPGGVIQGLDVVSKHTGPTNVNYLLRSSHAELSTTNGYFYTSDGCDLEMNKTYHVAMVYNGVSLKYYRNGFLLGETPATGNMIQSDLPTGIGFISTLLQAENFIGFINEVRIWKVARSQAQIRANMNISLVNPPAQAGLVAYYTFDNLLNKQGNPAWNGTLVGAASINRTNPECVFTADTCAVPSPCDQSLSIPTQGSKVTIGDVDVTGNQLTVEAMFNRSAPLNGGIYYGHLVSKHTDQTNVNYALLPNGCEITTSVSGYKAIFQTCVPELGKTYHVAMVYDGATLKFYRNGFLMSQVACTGNVVNNDLITTIGQVATGVDPFNNQFLGYTNEVRIWSVARTQSQIAAYMNKTLPNPTTQTGLRAYYSFNDLSNKQGNAAFDGTLHGSAAVGKINPDCGFVPSSCNTVTDVTPAFIVTDTVCVNTPVNITNISLNATSYYWNFCSGDINKTPTGTNLGNIGGLLSQPVFMDYAFYNGNYYGFSINHFPGKLVRLNFGNSLLNIPSATDLGNFGGIIPPGYGAEGIQIVQNEGKWYAIIVGGYTPSGSTPRILKIDFGANLANAAPIATDWGNIGNMFQPLDLHVFKEGNNWYGLTINAENNSVTRFSFTNSFDNVPTAVNLGGFGMLNYPTGIYAINDNGFWRVFITNNGNNSRLVRLDFGNSLLNTPTAVNLGSIGTSDGLRDLTIIKYCDQITGFAVNGTTNSLYRLNFATLTSIPTVTDLGNIGNLSTPHSISKLFRVNDDLYSFITNVGNNTLTRLRFTGCTNSNPANSALQTPPPVIYNTPGTYNINLTIDDGLPTQASVCKQVVVLPALLHNPTQKIVICDGSSIKIGSSSVIGTYQWNNGAVTDSIVVNRNGIYWVETNRFGCINRDSFDVTVSLPVNVELGNDKIICAAGNVVLDAGNSGSSYLWSNGSTNQTLIVTTAGQYYVQVTRNGCIASDTIRVTTYNVSSFDFNYKQNVCNPLSVQFNGIGATLTNFYWDFGDGSTLTSNISPVHQYQSAGNYIVSYSIGNGICSDTIRKTISINTTWDNLILTPDTTICSTSTKQLRTVPSLSFCWSPVTYLDNPNSPNPITSTPQDITYYFTAEVAGTNLISNGDFSAGNSGFTSQYNFVNNNTTEGEYFVGANPTSWNGGLSTCKDHSSGNGNMLLVNGAPVPNVTVWKQTVNVIPNTNYAFSTWIQALFTPNPAQLQFSINGKDIGPLITASLPTCTWIQFYTTWNSGDSTKAVISIVNKNTQVQGNDFALDDISFAPVFIKRDSVIIKVEHPIVKTNADTIICAGAAVQLNATGAQNYSWSPATGLTNTAVANPIATAVVSSQYIVTGTTINGCIAKDTVSINVFTKPAIITSNDTLVCKNGPVQLFASGGTGYSWSPAATLSNPLISNPVASPVTNTKYYVVVKDINTCEYRDSVEVTIRPDAVFAVNNPAPVCLFDSAQLIASGGNTYTWQIAEGLSNTSISNPKASPSVTTDYSVTITENLCNQSKTLVTRITVMPLPVVNAAKANDIDCRNDRSQLLASGAAQYAWTPAIALSSTQISNPVATPGSTTQYIVTGTAANGCSAKDTVDVIVYGKPAIVTSNDTTICKSSPAQLNVSGGLSYSWSPAATLNNPLVANPVASPLVSTKYYVLIRDAINCEYLDSVEVDVRPEAVFSVNSPTQVCKDGSVQLNASGGDTYSWLPAGSLNNAAISSPLASPASTTDYMVTITENTCNETATLNTRLTVLPSPTINVTKSNDIDCSNDRSQLIATGADAYIWTPAATLTNLAIFNPVAIPSVTTEYVVQGTDASGCKGYDTISVKVDNINKGGYLMPNAFTPNNDGLNDCYGVKYWGVIDELEFSVYNRWGERIFFTRNVGQCWDGTYKGAKQDGGVYVYMIKAKTNCQSEVFRKGTFVLVR